MTKKLPYTENYNLMDGRLLICGLAVGIAMFALAWDFLNPFPKVLSWALIPNPKTVFFRRL